MTLLNLRHVEYVVTAADAGSMTTAAAKLHVSQSAVSLAVASLERSLGVDLFIRRRGRGLTLTPAGRRFLPHARDLLAHAEDVRADAHAAGKELTGWLTVGCFRTAAPFLLPPLLETFEQRYPAVRLDFIEGSQAELERALVDGRCELAILYDTRVEIAIDAEHLYDAVPYALLAPEHPLADRAEVTLAELAELDMILLDIPPTREHQLGVFGRAGLTPEVRYTTSSYELLRSLVARNLGFGLLISRPHGDVSYEGRPLRVVPLGGEVAPVGLIIAFPKGVRSSLRARAFAEHCHELVPLIGPGAAATLSSTAAGRSQTPVAS